MLTADSDEGIRGDSVFNQKERNGEDFVLTRSEVNVRIIDFPLKIKDFVWK